MEILDIRTGKKLNVARERLMPLHQPYGFRLDAGATSEELAEHMSGRFCRYARYASVTSIGEISDGTDFFVVVEYRLRRKVSSP